MADRDRLFFALWPDEQVREQLVRVQQDTPRRGGRDTHAQDLHITLIFLGMVDSSRRGCVEAAAGGIQVPAFDLIVDHTDFWPRPKIAWCGPSEIPAPLQALVDGLKSDLVDCGFEPETRPYSPHVTLARDARSSDRGLISAPFCWHCDRFVLVTSASSREPPRYRIVREWPLLQTAENNSISDS